MRSDFTPDMQAALDAFAAPEPSPLLAERIVARQATAPPRRDPRGPWRLVRRATIGALAAGMVSAAAVASGLLGAAGIRVPVLTAMLAPAPVAPEPARPKPVLVVKRAPAVPAPKPRVVTRDEPTLAPLPPIETHVENALERRAARRQFIADHPGALPMLKHAMRRNREFVREHPEVRTLRALPPEQREAFLQTQPELRLAVENRRAERRAWFDAHPRAAEWLRERRAARRARAAPPEPVEEQGGGSADAR